MFTCLHVYNKYVDFKSENLQNLQHYSTFIQHLTFNIYNIQHLTFTFTAVSTIVCQQRFQINTVGTKTHTTHNQSTSSIAPIFF